MAYFLFQPPFFPLPGASVFFVVGHAQRVPWEGRGPLPQAVIDFVSENGVLPRHSPAEDGATWEVEIHEGVPSFSYGVDDWDPRGW